MARAGIPPLVMKRKKHLDAMPCEVSDRLPSGKIESIVELDCVRTKVQDLLDGRKVMAYRGCDHLVGSGHRTI